MMTGQKYNLLLGEKGGGKTQATWNLEDLE